MKPIIHRMFGSLAFAMAIIIGVGVGSSAYALDFGRVLLVDRLLVCDSYGAEAKRFELEQAYVASASDEHDVSVSADLRRDGQGYRQASADEYQGFGESISSV